MKKFKISVCFNCVNPLSVNPRKWSNTFCTFDKHLSVHEIPCSLFDLFSLIFAKFLKIHGGNKNFLINFTFFFSWGLTEDPARLIQYLYIAIFLNFLMIKLTRHYFLGWQATVSQSSLHNKWSFPLRVCPVNVTKFTRNCGFGHFYWKNP